MRLVYVCVCGGGGSKCASLYPMIGGGGGRVEVFVCFWGVSTNRVLHGLLHFSVTK